MIPAPILRDVRAYLAWQRESSAVKNWRTGIQLECQNYCFYLSIFLAQYFYFYLKSRIEGIKSGDSPNSALKNEILSRNDFDGT